VRPLMKFEQLPPLTVEGNSKHFASSPIEPKLPGTLVITVGLSQSPVQGVAQTPLMQVVPQVWPHPPQLASSSLMFVSQPATVELQSL
jgi:hypothetical protein